MVLDHRRLLLLTPSAVRLAGSATAHTRSTTGSIDHQLGLTVRLSRSVEALESEIEPFLVRRAACSRQIEGLETDGRDLGKGDGHRFDVGQGR